MKLGPVRLSISGASLAAGLLLAAAVQAEESMLVAEQLSQVPGAPSVQVYRGSVAETVSFDPAPEADSRGVVIFRGTTEPDEPPAVEAPAAAQAQLWATSGRDLWFYDPDGETLRACRLFKASRVGRYKIRCFERRLR